MARWFFRGVRCWSLGWGLLMFGVLGACAPGAATSSRAARQANVTSGPGLQSELASRPVILGEPARDVCLSSSVEAWPVAELALPPRVLGPRVVLAPGTFANLVLNLKFEHRTAQLVALDGAVALLATPAPWADFRQRLRARGEGCEAARDRLVAILGRAEAGSDLVLAKGCQVDRGSGWRATDCKQVRELSFGQMDRLVQAPRGQRLVSLALSTRALDLHRVHFDGASSSGCFPVSARTSDGAVVASLVALEPEQATARIEYSGSGCFGSALFVAQQQLDRRKQQALLDRALRQQELHSDD